MQCVHVHCTIPTSSSLANSSPVVMVSYSSSLLPPTSSAMMACLQQNTGVHCTEVERTEWVKITSSTCITNLVKIVREESHYWLVYVIHVLVLVFVSPLLKDVWNHVIAASCVCVEFPQSHTNSCWAVYLYQLHFELQEDGPTRQATTTMCGWSRGREAATESHYQEQLIAGGGTRQSSKWVGRSPKRR